MSNDATYEIRRLNAQLEERVAQLTAALEMKARELRDSEERFRYAMEVSHEGFWDWNIETGAFYCNPGLAERLDYDPAELSQYTARMWQDLLPPDEREAVVASIERHLRDSGHFEIEFKLRSKHGGYRWILSRGKVVERDADGAPLRAIGTHSDIEERKQADTLNRRLASIIESSSDLIATATPAGRVDYMNQAGRALLGIGATEPLEQTRIEDCHPAWAYRRVAEEGIPAALAQGRWLGDTAMLRRDGSEPPVSQLIISQRNQETGQVEFLSTICRDISERLRGEQALRRLQQEQALILDSAPAMIWFKDTQNRILRVNASAAKSVGLPKEKIEGRSTAEFYPGEADRYHRDDLIVAQSGRPRLGIEEPYQLPSGEKRWVRTDKVPLKDRSGRVNRILVMAVDITDRKHAEEALREADRQKDEFLATLAHELRNPLAPISYGLQILRLSRDNTEATDRALGMMEGQVRHMVRLIDDLLDLSRISLGKIQLNKTAVELATVVRHALESSEPLIVQSGHELQVNLPSESLLVEADLTRLAQAFANLLNNAAKYTALGGHVTLTVERQGHEAVVRVRDDGIGIPAVMLGKVFDMFTQVDRSLEKTHGGLGIGLSLVKRLVALHGGTVEARSEGHGKGSEFIVRLPILKSPAPQVRALPSHPGTPAAHRILVADDNANTVTGLALLLGMTGHQVRTARDGLEAVEVAAEFRPELILLDIGMPRLNGYDACRRIRTEPWGQGMVIVALTGWGQDQDKEKSRAAGFDQHLVKPIDSAELERLLDGLQHEAGE